MDTYVADISLGVGVAEVQKFIQNYLVINFNQIYNISCNDIQMIIQIKRADIQTNENI